MRVTDIHIPLILWQFPGQPRYHHRHRPYWSINHRIGPVIDHLKRTAGIKFKFPHNSVASFRDHCSFPANCDKAGYVRSQVPPPPLIGWSAFWLFRFFFGENCVQQLRTSSVADSWWASTLASSVNLLLADQLVQTRRDHVQLRNAMDIARDR